MSFPIDAQRLVLVLLGAVVAWTVTGTGRSVAGHAESEGAITPYGDVCPGSGDFTPDLIGFGSTQPGETFNLSLIHGLGGGLTLTIP